MQHEVHRNYWFFDFMRPLQHDIDASYTWVFCLSHKCWLASKTIRPRNRLGWLHALISCTPLPNLRFADSPVKQYLVWLIWIANNKVQDESMRLYLHFDIFRVIVIVDVVIIFRWIFVLSSFCTWIERTVIWKHLAIIIKSFMPDKNVKENSISDHKLLMQEVSFLFDLTQPLI